MRWRIIQRVNMKAHFLIFYCYLKILYFIKNWPINYNNYLFHLKTIIFRIIYKDKKLQLHINSVEMKIPRLKIFLISFGMLLYFFLLFGNKVRKIIFSILKVFFIHFFRIKFFYVKRRYNISLLNLLPIKIFKKRMTSKTIISLRDSFLRIRRK